MSIWDDYYSNTTNDPTSQRMMQQYGASPSFAMASGVDAADGYAGASTAKFLGYENKTNYYAPNGQDMGKISYGDPYELLKAAAFLGAFAVGGQGLGALAGGTGGMFGAGAAATTGAAETGAIGGSADVVVGGPMSVGGAVGTDLAPLAAGAGSAGATVSGLGSGSNGLTSSDTAFNSAMADSAGSGMQGLAGSDAAFNKALADAGLNQSMWSQIATKLGLPSGMSGSAATQILGALLSQHSGSKGMDLANKIMAQSDPFSGYRAFYGGKLMDLEKNPTSISSNPGFAVGEDALKRSMASQGYNGSGNMATALSDYSAKYFMDQRAQLAGLAGSNATPGAGMATAAQLTGDSLATQNNGWIQLLKGLGGSGFNLSNFGSNGGSVDTGANPVLSPASSI